MLRTPVSGSLVTHSVAVKYGAESNPGVEIGIGNVASPPPGLRKSSPVITISWQGGLSILVGGIGVAIARFQTSPISSTLTPMPVA